MEHLTNNQAVASSFFFNDTPTTEIYPLSLPDALPTWASSGPTGPEHRRRPRRSTGHRRGGRQAQPRRPRLRPPDRKSTRLNSSHGYISYAVFCLKKQFRIRMSRNFGMNMLTMTNLSTE